MKTDNVALRIATQSDTLELANLGRKSFSAAFAHLYSASVLEAFLRKTRSSHTYQYFIRCEEHQLFLAETSNLGIIGYTLY